MRVNVYAEELTTQVEWVTKENEGRRFYGIRIFLESSDKLHNTVADDDRSAITFWGPFHNRDASGPTLQAVFGAAQAALKNLDEMRLSASQSER